MKDKLIQSYKMVSTHNGTLFVYAFSYALILAIAPFLIIAVLVASQFLVNFGKLIDYLSYYIPSDLITPFVRYVSEVAPSDIVLLISLASVSFWVASKTVYSFLLESARIDDIKVSSLALRIISVIYFLLILLGAYVMVLVIGFFPGYNMIAVPLMLWALLCVFYRLVSFKFASFKDVYLGGLVAMVGLVVLGRLFFVYVNDFSNYENIYGPLASLMILLISVYFVAYIIYFGHCLNVSLDDGHDRKRKFHLKLIYKINRFFKSFGIAKNKES